MDTPRVLESSTSTQLDVHELGEAVWPQYVYRTGMPIITNTIHFTRYAAKQTPSSHALSRSRSPRSGIEAAHSRARVLSIPAVLFAQSVNLNASIHLYSVRVERGSNETLKAVYMLSYFPDISFFFLIAFTRIQWNPHNPVV